MRVDGGRGERRELGARERARRKNLRTWRELEKKNSVTSNPMMS